MHRNHKPMHDVFSSLVFWVFWGTGCVFVWFLLHWMNGATWILWERATESTLHFSRHFWQKKLSLQSISALVSSIVAALPTEQDNADTHTHTHTHLRAYFKWKKQNERTSPLIRSESLSWDEDARFVPNLLSFWRNVIYARNVGVAHSVSVQHINQGNVWRLHSRFECFPSAQNWWGSILQLKLISGEMSLTRLFCFHMQTCS